MSVVHLNHIRKKLEQDFCPHIDMSDYDGKPQHEIDAARLSRALAAFALAEHYRDPDGVNRSRVFTSHEEAERYERRVAAAKRERRERQLQTDLERF